ncbi:MAG: glyoxalase [Ilumatobacteraceae bacterium]|nr:glyoxalase [Ilumatobacteraceae bacterium]
MVDLDLMLSQELLRHSLVAVLIALFAGIYVRDLETATGWYSRLFGDEPSFFPNDAEAVWELAEHRSVYIEVKPESAGQSVVTIFVNDLDVRIAAIAERGIESFGRETYENGVSKVVYRDIDGNEVGFGGMTTAL